PAMPLLRACRRLWEGSFDAHNGRNPRFESPKMSKRFQRHNQLSKRQLSTSESRASTKIGSDSCCLQNSRATFITSPKESEGPGQELPHLIGSKPTALSISYRGFSF